MKRLIILLVWALLGCLPANAQSPTGLWFLNINGGRTTVGVNDPLPGGFKVQSFGTPISVTTSNSTGTLPTGSPIVIATNVGANTAYCALGASATTSSQYIPSGGSFPFIVIGATQLTCITSSSTTTVNMTAGYGNAGSGGGGGGSGGGGGNVTIISPLGSGVSATGVRTVEATDSPLIAAINAPVPLGSTSNGMTPLKLAALTNTAIAIKASAGQLYKLYCYNLNATVAYIQVYNVAAAGVTVGTTAALQSYGIPATSSSGFTHSLVGDQYGTAISAAATTTAGGGTAPGTAVDCNVSYN